MWLQTRITLVAILRKLVTLLGWLWTRIQSFRMVRRTTRPSRARSTPFIATRRPAALHHDSYVRNTVFFDIDDTICSCLKDENLLMIEFYCDQYYMFPHFKCVLDLLISHNCEIAFFSYGVDYRNEPLIDTYLSHETMFGRDKYEQLKAEGQFKVFSRHHLIMNGSNTCKSLKALMPNTSLDTMMLVDDYPNDEGSVVLVPYQFECNTMYYLLGLFKGYFETAAPTGKLLRAYYDELPKVSADRFNNIPTEFLKFTLDGLREVRKTCPLATLYRKKQLHHAFMRFPFNYDADTVAYIEAVLNSTPTDETFVLCPTIDV